MPGTEREQAPAPGHGVREERAGRPDGLGLFVADPLEQGDRGVEELAGRRTVAHAEASSVRVCRGSPCGLDHRDVNTATMAIRAAAEPVPGPPRSMRGAPWEGCRGRP